MDGGRRTGPREEDSARRCLFPKPLSDTARRHMMGAGPGGKANPSGSPHEDLFRHLGENAGPCISHEPRGGWGRGAPVRDGGIGGPLRANGEDVSR